jgi:hypothetical protein
MATATLSGTRPRVFLSSTIYDFADLRSAIKFWLEEMGYEVYASEFNDFRKDLDLNSYEACLKTIDTSDYFILLVGARAGGWFDVGSKTTITMAEYRRAYENAQKGRLKIVSFVRQSVWDTREDRKALSKLLREEYAMEHGLTEEDIERVANHSSRIIADTDTVYSFLNEVTRNADMKAATKGSAALPLANWIHRFSTFRDIVDALQTAFTNTFGLRRVALAANLHAELVENLRRLFQRDNDGTVKPAHLWASFARQQFSGGPGDVSSIIGNDLMWLSLFALMAKAGPYLRIQALNEAIVSGEFLDFDRRRDRYVVGSLQQILIQLRDEVDLLRREEAGLTVDQRRQLVDLFRQYKDVKEVVSVRNLGLVGAMSLHDRYANVSMLTRAVLGALDGGEIKELSLHPGTPFAKEALQIARETPSADDVLKWVRRVDR